MRHLTYRQVRDKLKMWEWELNFRWSVDDLTRAVEAQKEVTRWSDVLFTFPAENVLLTDKK
jgi:hypothetical protein